jgi:hypothetical protein
MDEDDDTEYGAPAKRVKGVLVHGNSQAGVLYAEEGQFNPHAARQQRKKAKKGAAKLTPTDKAARAKGEWGEHPAAAAAAAATKAAAAVACCCA